MKIDILTLFPNMFKDVFGDSMIGRAIENEIVEINTVNIRDFAEHKHNRVDDYPFGGGPGMVMKPEPIHRSLKSVGMEGARVIYMTPKGKVFNQQIAKELSKEKHLIFLCGHYEGVDERIIENYVTDEISIGDYVLTGGEIAAMAVVDAVARLLPGVLSKQDSYEMESHYDGLLEYPQYTRPREFEGSEVPEVLLSGHHKNIDEWRMYESFKVTLERRPDMIKGRKFTKQEKKIFDKVVSDIKKSSCK